MEVNIKIAVFLDVTPCSVVGIYQRFGRNIGTKFRSAASQKATILEHLLTASVVVSIRTS
jgi:hypothetical protein